MVKGYRPGFRLAASHRGRLRLYEASEAAGARVGGDLLDLAGKVRYLSLTNFGWRMEAVSPADELHQWAVLRTSAVPDTRPFDHYVEF